jgi:hypothetical protein
MLVPESHQYGGAWVFYVIAPIILFGFVASLWWIVRGAIAVFGPGAAVGSRKALPLKPDSLLGRGIGRASSRRPSRWAFTQLGRSGRTQATFRGLARSVRAQSWRKSWTFTRGPCATAPLLLMCHLSGSVEERRASGEHTFLFK